jgi:uncharacterized RDD family membrane protein YckC
VSNTAQQANIQYAGFWRRLVALFLDAALFAILSAPFMYLMIGHEYFYWLAGNEARLQQVSSLPFFLHKLAFFILIFAFWNVMSATPGKLLMGCHIVDAKTLKPISLKQAVIRLAGYFVSALPVYLGFVWAALDKRKQALHDKLASTLVVYHSDNYASKSIEELQNEFFNETGKLT